MEWKKGAGAEAVPMMGCRQQQAFVYETHTACSGNRCSLQATSHRSLLLSFISAHHPACHYTPDISISTAMFKFGSKRDLRSDMKCSIRMLNENEVLESVEFSRDAKGQFLLDHCFKYLNLSETDFFGLRFTDAHNQKCWLDASRAIVKQVRGPDPVLSFRVKFYPADPTRVREELTRFLMYLQLRRDLSQGRLQCTNDEMAFLLACVVQSELGDYDASEHTGEYVSSLKLMPTANPKLEEVVASMHQNEMRGQNPAEAENAFLRKAASLETYGVDPQAVKDHKGNQFNLGINHRGVLLFQGNRLTQLYAWKEIQKITYEGRMFIIHVFSSEKKLVMGYKCASASAVHFLWKTAIEHKYFFTMSSSRDVPVVTAGGGLLSKKIKVRYSGRVERELLEGGDRKNETGIRRSLSMSNTGSNARQPIVGRSSTLRRPQRTLAEEPEEASSFSGNAYFNYSAFSTFSEPGGEETGTNRLLNSSHPPLTHMQAFDEEWESSMNSTEFSMRPELTPTKTTDSQSNNVLTFEKPDVEGTPSMQRKEGENHVLGESTSRSSVRQRKLSQQFASTLKKSLLSCLFFLLLMTALLVFIIESESQMFAHLRKLPEMDLLRRDYYEPLKQIVSQTFRS